MNLSRPFIERPVATTLLMVALLLSGVMAYRLLPVAALPQVDYPIIQITTLYPGASPELTTRMVTAPRCARADGSPRPLQRTTRGFHPGAPAPCACFLR